MSQKLKFLFKLINYFRIMNALDLPLDLFYFMCYFKAASGEQPCVGRIMPTKSFGLAVRRH